MTAFLTAHAYLFAQIFGFAAMGVAISEYHFKKHRTIMLLMLLCSALWCVHYLFLGTMTGVYMNLVNVVRAAVYTQRDKKWAQTKWIPAGFILLSAAVTALSWANGWSILPFFASVAATLGNWQTDTQKLRLYTVGVCAGWLVYNIVNSSIAGAANEIFTLVSVGIALWRYRKKSLTNAG